MNSEYRIMNDKYKKLIEQNTSENSKRFKKFNEEIHQLKNSIKENVNDIQN